MKLLGARWFVFAGLLVLAAEAAVSYGLFQLAWWAVPVFWAAAGVLTVVAAELFDEADAQMPLISNTKDLLWLFAVVVLAFAIIVVVGSMWIVSTLERRGDGKTPVLAG